MKETYKIGIWGASGRMGLEIASLLRDSFEVHGDLLELHEAIVGRSSLTSIEGVRTKKKDDPSIDKVHAWIDFSLPEATMDLLEVAQAPLVIGTTGFNDTHLGAIRAYSQKYPVLLASNTSYSVYLFKKLLKQLRPTEALPFDVVVEESHHRFKKDRPSGTANSLLEVLQEQGFRNIQVNAIRAGNIKGIHTVKFISDDETLEIKHEITDRAVFAKGSLLAAQFMASQKEKRMYTMDEVFLNSTT